MVTPEDLHMFEQLVAFSRAKNPDLTLEDHHDRAVRTMAVMRPTLADQILGRHKDRCGSQMLQVQRSTSQPEWMSRLTAVEEVPDSLREAVAALGPGERVQGGNVLVCFPAFLFTLTATHRYVVLWASMLGPATGQCYRLADHLADLGGSWGTEPAPGELWLGSWDAMFGPPSDDGCDDNFWINLLLSNPAPAPAKTDDAADAE